MPLELALGQAAIATLVELQTLAFHLVCGWQFACAVVRVEDLKLEFQKPLKCLQHIGRHPCQVVVEFLVDFQICV